MENQKILEFKNQKKHLISLSKPSFCDNCIFLNITEEEQNKQKNKDRHICNRYGKVLLHNGYHPRIPVLTECDL